MKLFSINGVCDFKMITIKYEIKKSKVNLAIKQIKPPKIIPNTDVSIK